MLSPEKVALLAIQAQIRQAPSCESASIDADSVRAFLWEIADGVAVHNHSAEIRLWFKEFIPDPDHVFRVLIAESHAPAGTNT